MATINKYVTETINELDRHRSIKIKYKYTSDTINETDKSLYGKRQNKYIVDTINETDKSLYGKRQNKYIVDTIDIFASNSVIKSKAHLEIVNLSETTYFYRHKYKKINETLQNQEYIKSHIQHYLIYDRLTHKQITKISYIPIATLFDVLTPDVTPNVISVRHPEITGLKPIILDNLYTTHTTPTNTDIYLYEKNTLKTDKGSFEFRLGVITTEKRLEVTLASTYKEDLTIENVTSDDDLGIYAEFPNGTTIPENSGLPFIFKIKIDEGKEYVENKVYFHLNNGLIIEWKFCFIRALTNLYFLVPDKNTYKENYIFYSKTFVSLGGRKDVVAFMDTPKQSFSATYSYRPYNELEAMRNIALMNEYQNAYFPIWSELSNITKTQTKATYLIYVDKISSFIKPNSKIALINLKYPMKFNILNVKNISYKDNTVVSSNSVTYTTDYVVLPIVEVILTQNPSTQYYNIKDQKLSISVRTLE